MLFPLLFALGVAGFGCPGSLLLCCLDGLCVVCLLLNSVGHFVA